MKILFLDQSGKPGGAELCLIDIAKPYRSNCLVGLFADGSFRDLLEKNQIPVKILTNQAIQVRKESTLIQGLASLTQLLPLINKVAKIASDYDLIYANTQKALVIGAIASFLSRRPLVYHLHDILSPEHFSKTNRTIAVTLANRFAKLIIANSQASKTAFIEAGGRADIVEVVYNGFDSTSYQVNEAQIKQLRQELQLEDKFVIGHFSRLSPWKGQHILIEAIAQSSQEVTAILVGDALFGEQEYVKQLHEQVEKHQLQNRVKFLGFRSDIPQLMSACDLVAHTSIAAEPFGRVIVEAMLCGKPVVAASAGGAIEIVENNINGYLVTPGEPQELAQIIKTCFKEPSKTATLADNALRSARSRFDVEVINQQITQVLSKI
ncbi:glycosyl transferase [Dulcicalothrix desertica PCC 7102]|uniref:Glycosyl transferase n=1 Tax=Dulcicalothrix desertica PCC 7102 TaxID=232991 RepID=A0A433VQJ2_9CYAN|nr:glycosyltransferase family 4 protein [Dulcicalothrix desertica]RUT08374.1 glycosyl transferase [Dulcicalothrix desertica PCC 7102]TWH40239.1 glycosyltransferase involved in cell wall biosynthesis [Dulcicalothrix desertica PCC 7102]